MRRSVVVVVAGGAASAAWAQDPTGTVSGSEQWRYAPYLELLPNQCDRDIAHRYLDAD
jgi:hypothetical protein